MAIKKGVDRPFLNGVCRHELNNRIWLFNPRFLNGVCRHEHAASIDVTSVVFLNGVCRHEPYGLQQR